MRRLPVGRRPHDVFAPVRRKAAVAVPEVQLRLRGGRGLGIVGQGAAGRGGPLGRGGRVLGVGEALDLVGQTPVASVQHDPRAGQQRLERLRRQLVAPDRVQMAVDAALRLGRLDHGLQLVLQVLNVARRPLVQHHDVVGHAARAQELVHPQRLADDRQVAFVVDADQDDRVVARNPHRPQRRLRPHPPVRAAVQRQPHVGPDQQRGEAAEQPRILKRDAQVAQLHLRIGPGKAQLVVEHLGADIVGREPVAFLGAARYQRPEGQRHGLTRGHPDPAADREAGVHRVALTAAQRRAGVEGGGIGQATAAADEGASVGFRLGRGRARAVGAGDQMGEEARLALGVARFPLRHDQRAAVADLGFHEHLRKGGVGAVGGRGVQHDLAIGRDLDRAVAARAVAQRQPAAVGVCVGRGDHLEPAFDRVRGLEELGLVVREHGRGPLVLGRAGARRRGPPFVRLGVAHHDVDAAVVAGRIGRPAVDRHVAQHRPPGPGRGHEGRELAVRDQPDLAFGPGWVVHEGHGVAFGDAAAHVHVRPRRRTGHRHDVARRFFLQHQLGRAHHRIVVEAVAVDAVEDRVGDREDRHAVVVRHHVADDRMVDAVAQPRAGEVDRVVKAVRPLGPDRAQRGKVLERRLRAQLRRHDRRVGRDNLIVPRSFQRKRGHAEGVVLVVHVAVAGVEGAFRHAPRNVARPAPVDVDIDRHLVRGVQDPALAFLQQKRRHQVFEHAARPRQQRAFAADVGKGAPQTAPVFLPQVALGDGQERGQPRLGREQVVAGFVQLLVVGAVAHRQKHLVGIDQHGEVHLEREHPRAFRHQPDPQRKGLKRVAAFGQGLQHVVAVAHQRPRPVRDLGPLVARQAAGKVGRKAVDVGRERPQLPLRQRPPAALGRNLLQRHGKPRHRRVERLAQLAQRALRFGQRRDAGPQDTQCVGDAARAGLADRRRLAGPAAQARRQRHQRAREVAAVHRRDIGLRQNRQRAGVVPVEVVAAEPGHPLHRGKGRVDPLQRRLDPDPAEVAGRHHRQQIQADIGRRGAFRELRRGCFLKVVGRQVVGVGADEVLEEAPGQAADAAQRGLVLVGQVQAVLRFQRARCAEHDERRGDPQAAQDQRHRQRDGVHDRGGDQRGHADCDRSGHPAIAVRQACRAAPGLARGRPFQQVLAADRQPPQRAPDRIDRTGGAVRHRGDDQAKFGHVVARVAQHQPQLVADRDAVLARHDLQVHLQDRDERQQQDQKRLPDQRPRGGQRQPARDRRRDKGGRQQAAAQVVEHLEPAEPIEPVPRVEDERQQLPVAADPAVLAARLGRVAQGKVLDHLDVGDEGRAGKAAFQQVVAQHRVLGHAAGARALERVHVVDALAGEAADIEQVLIQVRDGEHVGVEAPVRRKHALEHGRVRAGRERGRDARLHDRVAAHDDAVGAVDGTVDRVRHLARKGGHGVAGQAGVAVQRHDVADPFGRDRPGGDEAGGGGVAQQRVQFGQLAALAFPPHPHAFGRVPQPAPVQQEEPAHAAVAVAVGQPLDPLDGVVKQALVVGQFLGGGVAPVGQKREADRAQRVGEIVGFQHLGQFVDRVDAGQHAGDHDERARVLGHAHAEVEGGQALGRHGPRGQERHQPHRGFRRDQRAAQAKNGQHPGRQAVGRQRGHQRPDQQRGHGQDRRDQPPDAGGPDGPPDLFAPARAIAAIGREAVPVRTHQQVAQLDRAAALAALGAPARDRQQPFGHRHLGQGRASGDAFDRVAVAGAGGLVEMRELPLAREGRVDQADALEPVQPVHVAHAAQAAHDVAHGDVAGRLAGVFRLDRAVGGPGAAQQAVDFLQRDLAVRAGVAHPVQKLRGDRVVLEEPDPAVQRGADRGRPVQRRQLVGKLVRALAAFPGQVHPVRQAAQVLDQHVAQEGRHRPQLGHAQRHLGLVAAQELGQRLRRDFRVAERDVIPRDHHAARGRSALRQRHAGQPAQELAVEAVAQLAQVFLDHVVVVDQPLGRGRHVLAGLGVGHGGKVVAPDRVLVVAQAGDQPVGRAVDQRVVGPRKLAPRLEQRAAGPDVEPDRRGQGAGGDGRPAATGAADEIRQSAEARLINHVPNPA